MLWMFFAAFVEIFNFLAHILSIVVTFVLNSYCLILLLEFQPQK